MRGSHAPSLRTIVARQLDGELSAARGLRIVCACSGGPDSMAMLHVLAMLRERASLELVAVAVDHGLRAEAAAEIELVARLASRLDVPFEVARVDVAPGSDLQARARSARYEALRAARSAHGAALIATAHTADDRAETVLLRIFRGAGVRGLAVLPPLAGDLVRPLVRARRSDVELHLRRHGVPFATDPSNVDARFLRARVRAEILPALRSVDPRVVEHLVALADDATSMSEAPDPLAALGRRQREQVAGALRRQPRGTRVRVADREEVLVRLVDGRPVAKLVSAPPPRRRG